jgi:hypothetical protein
MTQRPVLGIVLMTATGQAVVAIDPGDQRAMFENLDSTQIESLPAVQFDVRLGEIETDWMMGIMEEGDWFQA